MSFTPGQKVTVTFPADFAGLAMDLAGKTVEGAVDQVVAFDKLRIVFKSSGDRYGYL